MTTPGLGPHYRRFWVASAVSNLGDGIRWTALPLLTAAITRDPTVVAGTQVAIWAPQLLFGLVGGAIVDRVDRRLLVTNFQYARAVVMAALAAVTLTGDVTVPMIYGAAFLIGVGEVFVDGAAQTIVRSLLSDDQLESGYGKLWAVDLSANEFIGPPVGGLLFSITRWVPFATDAVSFAVAGALVQRLPADALARPQRTPSTLRADIVEGLRALWSIKLMRVTTLAVAAHGLLSSASYAIYVLFALQVLDTDAVGFGLIISAGGVGGVLATLVASQVVGIIGRGGIMWGGTIVSGLAIFFTGFTSNAIVAGVLQFVMLFSISLWNVVGRALRASIVPDRLLGRVVASGRMLAWGSIPVGSVLGGVIAENYGLRMPFYLGGGLIALVGMLTIPWLNTTQIEATRSAIREEKQRSNE
jgi:MFS family permease